MKAMSLLVHQSAGSLQLATACVGLTVAAGGLAHFVWPQQFEPLNKTLGFTSHTRLHVYVNGAIETVLGVTLISPKTRKLNAALSFGYPIYLSLNTFRARRQR
jgi:uncharacterized membrane protein